MTVGFPPCKTPEGMPRVLDADLQRAAKRKHRRTKRGAVDATGESKGGACEICGDNCAQLHWDHCHTSGAFRGWLCNGCNQGLGSFKDDPKRLTAAIAYLLGRAVPPG